MTAMKLYVENLSSNNLKDSFGKSDLAILHYQEALTLGLNGIRRRRAVI